MGWNSWNSFATTITEAQTLENAQIMARDLLPSGYDILTVDIQWYDPSATGYDYNAKPVPAMDGHGRLLPAPNRFPSSAGGKGFAPLASQVHAMGLRFGVHLLRGIPASPWSATCRFWARHHRPRHRRHQQHLPVEPGHVRRRHAPPRRSGLLRQRVQTAGLMGRGFRQGG
jgi:hypothetical protein